MRKQGEIMKTLQPILLRMSTCPFPSSTALLATSRALDASRRSNDIQSASPPVAPDFRYGLFATIGIATDDYDMDAKLSQFIGCRPANTAG